MVYHLKGRGMKKHWWSLLIVAVLVLVLAGCNAPQSTGKAETKNESGSTKEADKFPEKPITILVHTSAGGPTDLMAREYGAVGSGHNVA